MNKYSIITYATVTTEYIVEAENEEEAEDKYVNGEHLDSNDLDYHDEIKSKKSFNNTLLGRAFILIVVITVIFFAIYFSGIYV